MKFKVTISILTFNRAQKLSQILNDIQLQNKNDFYKIIIYDNCSTDNTIEIIKKVWIYIVIGIGIGAWIHGYVPTDLLVKYAGNGNWYSVPLAVLIGIPLYSNAAGIIPIVSALIEKGAALGTALAFMMSVIGLSLPEMIILRKVLKLPLIFTFIVVVGTGIILVGFLFNYVF